MARPGGIDGQHHQANDPVDHAMGVSPGSPRSTKPSTATALGNRHRRLFALKKDAQRWLDEQTAGRVTGDLGSFVGTSTLHGAWQRAARRLGTDATPHDLRQYFASVQIRGGQSIKALQALLGHKSAVETWDTYGHLMGDEDNRSRAVIDAALGGLGSGLVRQSRAPATAVGHGNHRRVKK